jgi:hypothetical protein
MPGAFSLAASERRRTTSAGTLFCGQVSVISHDGVARRREQRGGRDAHGGRLPRTVAVLSAADLGILILASAFRLAEQDEILICLSAGMF